LLLGEAVAVFVLVPCVARGTGALVDLTAARAAVEADPDSLLENHGVSSWVLPALLGVVVRVVRQTSIALAQEHLF
jgi:hypothetical protein